ncbi:hypothetical protein WR25_09505 isoform C [Diploscapter pachys]|uniref:SAM domain-containing protein n=1 Tax=Diploscapter pachys TaxID=2018661 RepID=A0A2A2J3G0_9BILA|nr:hypothetical protein WR25_09505 isoform C [Diploscapter pachys]
MVHLRYLVHSHVRLCNNNTASTRNTKCTDTTKKVAEVKWQSKARMRRGDRQYRLKDDEGGVKGEARRGEREGDDCDAWGGASVPSQCETIDVTGPVKEWMIAEGFSDYVDLFVNKHRIDGPALLMLSEFDLRDSMKIDCIGDVKRILLAIERLKLSLKARSRSVSKCMENDVLFHVEYDRPRRVSLSGEDVFIRTRNSVIISDDELTESIGPESTIKSIHLISREEIIRHVESPDTELKSFLKMVIACGYCLLALLVTAFVMVVVHDRVPDMKTYPPLPDLVLDNLPLIPWAFEMCEVIGLILFSLWTIILVFHKYRIILLRRMFSLVGTVFLLRCITMLITSLSVPGVHLECRSKSYGSLKDKLAQAFVIWSHGGMSIQGVRTCGDYMFSGHTTVVTLLNHFITEYTPQSWSYLHTTTWVLNFFAIFFILAGHEHYSIDVFIG